MRFRTPVVLGLVVACLAPDLVVAQTIDDAFAAAYRNNPRILAQRARLRATDENVPQALSNWRPTLSFRGDTGITREDSNTSRFEPLQVREPKTVALNLEQPLFRGGRTLAATSQAENQIKAERARLITIEQTVMLDAATAYLDVFRDLAVLQLNINNEQVLRRQLEAARDRFQVGEITRTDVFQAEARLARATADRIQAESNLETSRAAYQQVVGEPAPAQPVLPQVPVDLPKSKIDAGKIAAANNPNVTAAEYDARAATDNIDVVWGELLPTVSVLGTASKAYEATSENSITSTIEGILRVSVPIYQSGSTYSRLRAARQSVGERRSVIDQERRVATETAARSWENLQAAHARVDQFLVQIRAATVALEGVEREAAVGSRTVLDVLDAEQELLDAKVNHVRAQRDELVNGYELRSAVGQLTAGSMGLNVERYNPDDHYREVRDKWFGGKSKGGVN